MTDIEVEEFWESSNNKAEKFDKESNYVWIVQTFSHNTYEMPSVGKAYEVCYVHTASSLNKALEFCIKYSDYAGNKDDWHWYISRVLVDVDECNEVSIDRIDYHYTRDGKPCEINGNNTSLSSEEFLDTFKDKLYRLLDQHTEEIELIVEEQLEKILQAKE